MSITDIGNPAFDAELRRLTAEHPGIAIRTRATRRKTRTAVRKAARRAGRSMARGWARVRGTLGSLAALGLGTAAAFLGLGLIAGLLALGAALVLAEWLLK